MAAATAAAAQPAEAAAAAAAPAGREAPAPVAPSPSPAGKRTGRAASSKKAKPIKLVGLNLNRCDTWQQPVPAYWPVSRAKQKAETKRIHQCTYTVQ